MVFLFLALQIIKLLKTLFQWTSDTDKKCFPTIFFLILMSTNMDCIIKLVKLFNSICNYVYKIVGSGYIYIFFNVMLLNKFIATNFKLLSQNLQI